MTWAICISMAADAVGYFATAILWNLGTRSCRSCTRRTHRSIDRTGGELAFVNDTLIMPDVGTARADFPGASARELWQTFRSLLTLPDHTHPFVGHDYPSEVQSPCGQTNIRA